ncbi:MAG TPA: lipoyl synthase, partial [Thermoguttaceae bacterium]|nr:lipoyl synthase [Thermoguttaceae bacterium]
MTPSCPSESTPPHGRLPRWLKRRVPAAGANRTTVDVVRQLGLATVCDHARCPNRMECYAAKTATFMILGDTC